MSKRHHTPLKGRGSAANPDNRYQEHKREWLDDGKTYDAKFGERMRGTGHFAELINQRFHIAYKKLGFEGMGELDCSRFILPSAQEGQLSLF